MRGVEARSILDPYRSFQRRDPSPHRKERPCECGLGMPPCKRSGRLAARCEPTGPSTRTPQAGEGAASRTRQGQGVAGGEHRATRRTRLLRRCAVRPGRGAGAGQSARQRRAVAATSPLELRRRRAARRLPARAWRLPPAPTVAGQLSSFESHVLQCPAPSQKNWAIASTQFERRNGGAGQPFDACAASAASSGLDPGPAGYGLSRYPNTPSVRLWHIAACSPEGQRDAAGGWRKTTTARRPHDRSHVSTISYQAEPVVPRETPSQHLLRLLVAHGPALACSSSSQAAARRRSSQA